MHPAPPREPPETEMELVLVETSAGVMKITLNRPEVLNSFNLAVRRRV